MDKLPLSVNISTYNEEKNIGYCLDCVLKNNPAEIIVIDAGSTDRTRVIAESKGAKVVVVGKKGLAFQRNEGLKYSSCPFIAMVDAQDKLTEDCMAILLNEMEIHGYDAIQAQTFARRLETYWENAYEFNTTLSINTPGPTNMVGRPCVYRAEKIKAVGFDPFFGFGVGCEDVDISIQFEQRRYLQGMGTGKVHRDHPSDFRAWWEKWVKYGRGDARIIAKYPNKKKAIRAHQLFGYPIKRSWHAICHGGVRYVPFFVFFGLVRYFTSLSESRRIKEGGKS